MRRALGVLALLAPLASMPVLACVCTGSTPEQRTCDPPTAPSEVTAVTIVRTADYDHAPIEDGDAIPIHFGATGGHHVRIAVRLEGSGFGGCIAQRTELLSLGRVPITGSSANVPLEVQGSTATTAPILLFPEAAPARGILRVEIAERIVERVVGASPDDGG